MLLQQRGLSLPPYSTGYPGYIIYTVLTVRAALQHSATAPRLPSSQLVAGIARGGSSSGQLAVAELIAANGTAVPCCRYRLRNKLPVMRKLPQIQYIKCMV